MSIMIENSTYYERMIALRPTAAAVIAFLFIGIIGGQFCIPPMIASYHLGQSFRTTQGTIVNVFPQNHCTCTYTFYVAGVAYQAHGSSCCGVPVGEKATIYYSPEDPHRSLNHPPMENLYNDLIPFSLALILIPLFAYMVNRRVTSEDSPQ